MPKPTIDRDEHIRALGFQLDATFADIGRMLAELQESLGSARTLQHEIERAYQAGAAPSAAVDTE